MDYDANPLSTARLNALAVLSMAPLSALDLAGILDVSRARGHQVVQRLLTLGLVRRHGGWPSTYETTDEGRALLDPLKTAKRRA